MHAAGRWAHLFRFHFAESRSTPGYRAPRIGLSVAHHLDQLRQGQVFRCLSSVWHVLHENGKRRKIFVSRNIPFSQIKVSGAFHGAILTKKLLKIPKVLKLMQFPCADALSYSHLCEGKIDVVFQGMNKIWDIHPLIPIIKASGGVVTTWNNKDAINAGSILVSANKSIHNKMLKLLKPISK